MVSTVRIVPRYVPTYSSTVAIVVSTATMLASTMASISKGQENIQQEVGSLRALLQQVRRKGTYLYRYSSTEYPSLSIGAKLHGRKSGNVDSQFF